MTFDSRPPRSGLTLIELLVVIVILTTIVAAAIPIMSPANDDRRLREASRGLNTFITAAQARAIATGRPFGIALKRLSQDTNTDPTKATNPSVDRHDDNAVCVEAFYVEQPKPYAGFDANSRACVALHPGLNQIGLALVNFVTRGNGSTNDRLPVGWDADQFPSGMLRPGDVIEVGGTRLVLVYLEQDQDDNVTIDENGYYKSTQGNFNLNTPSAVVRIAARPLNDTGQLIVPEYDNRGRSLAGDSTTNEPRVPPFWTEPAPYKILRQPTPTADEPFQLPDGVAIDLRASGVGLFDYFYVEGMNDNSDGVIIMFTPEGRVARVTYSQLPIDNPNEEPTFDRPVADNIYLLVGKRENAPGPAVRDDLTLDPTEWNRATTPEARDRLREPVNWLRGDARWVVIGSQSGRVVTIENAFVDPNAVFNDPQPSISASPSTEEMRTRQILAAREFTRDMRQLGGR